MGQAKKLKEWRVAPSGGCVGGRYVNGKAARAGTIAEIVLTVRGWVASAPI
jgi:hypothetical protein